MVATPFSQGVAVEIRGDSSGLRGAVDNALASLGSLRTAALGVGAVLGGLAVGGLAVATNAAADFEEQMVELEKVTDPETAAAMRSEIMDMASEMPVAQEELAGIAAQAGRFGIEGSENIRQFTESTARMAVATDLSAQEAGEAFARLTQVTGEPVENVEHLGSVVNELSNTMATSSSEITNAATRSAAQLSQLGLRSEEILALNASMNEVSASSRIAGTRLRRLAQEMMDPGQAEDLAEAMGMSVDEFERIRDEDPGQLIQRMAESFAEGGETADALRSTLSTTSRSALAGLAQNLEGLEEANAAANEQMAEGTSLQEEYASATDTFNARLAVTANKVRNIAIAIGEEVLPAATDFVDELNAGLSTVEDWIEGGEDAEGSLGGLAAGFEDAQSAGQRAMRGLRRLHDRHLGDILARTQRVLAGIRRFWDAHGDAIMRIVGFALDNVRIVLEGALDSLLSLVRFWLAVFQGDWGDAWNIVTGLARRNLGRLVGIVRNSLGAWGEVLGILVDIAIGAFRHLVGIVITNEDSLIRTLIGRSAEWLRTTGKSMAASAFRTVVDAIEAVLRSIGLGPVADAINTVIDLATEAIARLERLASMRQGGMSAEERREANARATNAAAGTALASPGPGVHTGGFIERTGTAVLHAGERVVPEAQVTDRGEVQAAGANPEEIADAIERTDRTDAIVDELRRVRGAVETVAEETGAEIEFRDGDRWRAARR